MNNMIRNPNGKLLYAKITFQPFVQGLGHYKHQIRWFQDTKKYFESIGDYETAEGYQDIINLLKEKLEYLAQ